MTVLEFKPKKEPHVSGMARCLDCKHEWLAVAPASDMDDDKQEGWLECPSCSLQKGRFIHAYAPAEGTNVWTCNCRNRLFYITPEGTICPNCGVYAVFP